MGIIKMPPKDIRYPFPKALGKGYSVGTIIGRAMHIERFNNWGDYMRILDWIKFEDGHKELRFAQFYRKPGGTDKNWIYGQGAGHVKAKTFLKLIRKAKTKPDYGTFEDALDHVYIK